MHSHTQNDRFNRQERIPGWRQDKLAGATVLVLGAGALGNELVKNLALTGVGRLMIVDMDTIELSNLSRTALFREADIGRPKAATLAQAAMALTPLLQAVYIHADIRFNLGLGFYRAADLVIGCLDNLEARIKANECAALVGKPYLDTGIWAHGGEVKWFFPGSSACFGCSIAPEDKAILATRISCTGFRNVTGTGAKPPMPTALPPAAVIAGLAAQEACYYLTGHRPIAPAEAIAYDGINLTLRRTQLPRNLQCAYHIEQPYRGIQPLALSATGTTAHTLIAMATKLLGPGVTLELGRDLLASFYCTHCDDTEEIYKNLLLMDEASSHCPVCGHKRKKHLFTATTLNHHLAQLPLQRLGIPPGEVLLLHALDSTALYELKADVDALFYQQNPF